MYYTKGVWNRLLGILLLLCLGTMAPAQKKSVLPKGGKAKGDPPKVALIWGDTFQIPNHYTSLALLRIPGKGLVEVFNRDLKSFLLKKHEGHAKMPEMNNITLDFLPAATTSELFVTLRGHIYWLYSYW
ncbi:MAG TPA: hypothetical protein VNZ86_03000, partial [Bacteroidia bacterium]|nr:hypothetical protein [Bacteroidia bacterium]